MLRLSHINPKLSAYAQIEGNFDFNRTPLAPPGTHVVAQEKNGQCDTWDTHGVDATWAEQVQSDFTLAEEAAPQAERDLGVGGGKAGNEMILVGADSTFRGIVAMAMWRCELEIDGLFMHVVAKCLA